MPDRMNRNDFILLAVFMSMLLALLLLAFAPVADSATLTMRVWAVAGSPISINVISTFIAAFAGTWGAQLLAERTANRKALLSEIRGTNAALGLVFSIVNTYITVKKHLRGSAVEKYETQVAARKAHLAGPGAGSPFPYKLDLETTLPPYSPIDELQQMLREKITPDGKALILLVPLVQSIQGLAHTMSQRNAWISEVRAMPNDSDTLKAALFFGHPYAQGRIDERYPSFIKAFKLQADDCIAFSMLIGESLIEYGERLAARYGDGAPKISKANYDKAGDLLPDMSFYADWTKN